MKHCIRIFAVALLLIAPLFVSYAAAPRSAECAAFALPPELPPGWYPARNPCYMRLLDSLENRVRAGVSDEEKYAVYGMLVETKAMVGDEAGALATVESLEGEPIAPDYDPAAAFAGATPTPALAAIVQAARSRQIVIINETHYVPRHRMFTRQLVRALRPLGYRYFAAEAFEADPTEFGASIVRGVPTVRSGAYVRDPVFGNMVRDAVQLGYTLVPYEATAAEQAGSSAPRDALEAHERREGAQARHLIERVFARDPNAKLIIHVGLSHAIEVPVASRARPGTQAKWMAARLKEATGLDPLTIDQAVLSPANDPKFDAPEYGIATKSIGNSPTVFRKRRGFVSAGSYAGQMDMSVAHPRTRLIGGRPDWLLAIGDTRLVDVPPKLLPRSGRRLVQAFRREDPADAIPLDQVVITAGRPVPKLVLPRTGALKFVIQD